MVLASRASGYLLKSSIFNVSMHGKHFLLQEKGVLGIGGLNEMAL